MVKDAPRPDYPASPAVAQFKWYSGLRARLFFFGIAVALPLIALSTWRQFERWQQESEEIEDAVMHASRLVTERIGARVQIAAVRLQTMGVSVGFDTRDRARNDSLLDRWHTTGSSAYTNFVAYNTNGSLVGAAVYRPMMDSIQTATLRLLDRLKSTPQLAFGLRNRLRAAGDNPYTVLLTRGVFSNDTLKGMVSLTIRLDSLAEGATIPSITKGTTVTLFDTTGNVLAVSTDGEINIPDSLQAVAPVGIDSAPGVSRVRQQSGGQYMLVGHSRIEGTPWYVNVSIPEATVRAPQRAAALRGLALAIAIIGLAPIVAWLLGGRLVKPINILASDANTIARGLTSHRSRVVDSSEIGVLARAFNHMADTVERRNAALGDSERRYRLLFDSNPLPMYGWDAENMRILAVNEAALEHYGYDRHEFLSLQITDLIDPIDHERFTRRRLPFSENRQHAGLWTHRTKDGRRMEMDVITTSSRRLGRAGWLSVAIDSTARREAERALARSEEQLRQAQKMEAIGAFAGGIAHDFNNLLTGMLGYCDLALMDLDSESSARADVSELRKLAVRGADLTRQILAASRRQTAQPVVTELNTLVHGMEGLLARIIGEHIRIVASLDEDIARITADPGQLEQVLLNLAANARDAMPVGGELHIRTYLVTDSERDMNLLDPDTSWVAISVRDTGIGMTDEVRERIFEPFFTTKERGKGTGLGLALAYGMVGQVGGVIRVASQVNAGATFTIYFPAVTEPSTSPPTHEHPVRDMHGTETILIAEDEASVRSIAVAALRRWGYDVLAAEDGAAALAMARNHSGTIHLLFTDMVMPGMNGRELAELIQEARPEIKVVFASGYTDDEELLRGIRLEDIPFLQKPFTANELIHAVRDVLDGIHQS